ncbi:hypothetical protein BDN71DRAFT_738910 [Pleurotus eryngii]|uniref:Uncharacterized protein n=1 Tax=Pleurotus eryngii TaxID=5323 RepID=A0A9P5ZH95_PLEER|nr:hypothetical protein BDN71DRAFT_738910 [Pleurotus eryngii]
MRRRWGPGGDGSGKEGGKEWGVEKAERGVYIPTRRILLLTYRHSTIQKVCPATSRGRVAASSSTGRVCEPPFETYGQIRIWRRCCFSRCEASLISYKAVREQ